MTWETIIVGIIASLPGIYGLWQGRNKLSAETAAEWMKVAQATAAELRILQEDLRQEKEARRETGRQVIQLDEQMRRMEVVLEHYRDGTNRLIGYIIAKGDKPPWTPDEDEVLKKYDNRKGVK